MTIEICKTAEALRKHRDENLDKSKFALNIIPFDSTKSWFLKHGTVSHESRGFFHILGLTLPNTDFESIVLYQPQSALTGLLIAEHDGEMYTCVQARAEPGNTGVVQYGPTVQSTAANYMKLHGGRDTDFIDHFQSYPSGSRLISFSMQVDLGELYYQKSKTHNYIETDKLLPTTLNTTWVPISVLSDMSLEPFFLNTDLRSLAAMYDWDYHVTGERSSDEPPTELLDFYFRSKGRTKQQYLLTSLHELKNWRLGSSGVEAVGEHTRYMCLFECQALTREVATWVQPLIGVESPGLVVLYRRVTASGPEYLLSVREEYGIDNQSIIAPSRVVHPGGDISAVDRVGTVYRTFEHSEEGGRFINHESTFEIRNVDGSYERLANEFWVTPGQLKQLFLCSNIISIQLRVMACGLLDELNPKTLGSNRPAQ
ncbi:NDP-hexose 2,3-dehydratase (plasmid) [Hoeflea sp. IMCC20628]|uniref:NDP-hexose 2,3-dehydratase family protein n=1 Tax=Hoeflea sp. IMCC20628 TaxID=1620421 RepID=UPI00063AB22D|nr:NDP-hexose 2,3-dehydratase family protein [Hoeflea sp. IMCC20628]AKI03377.1 NDP-hexose 2,3-dehydratase [Hoeflea sp. IMCC20628]